MSAQAEPPLLPARSRQLPGTARRSRSRGRARAASPASTASVNPALRPRWRTCPAAPIACTFQESLVKQVVSALKEAGEIMVCTDAGREGELIAMELIEYAGCLGTPRKRLWTSVLNQEGLKEALRSLRDGSATMGLFHAGVARERVDFMEGVTYSRAMALKDASRTNESVGVGRVQSPALGFVV